MKHAWRLLLIVGILIAIVGAGIDFILPGTSPGLNLPQILIIAAGFSLSALAWQLRRPGVRRRLSKAMGRTLLAAFAITGVTLILLELILAVFGMSTYYFATPPPIRVTPIDWWVCDEPGCHYIYDNVMADCQKGGVPKRICAINRQGFAGPQEFVAPQVYDDRMRILFLGDSFTFGSSANLGMSFAELLESEFADALIWNAAISGTGTNQAIETLDYFAPQLRPQLTILGFYMNDFGDNLLPIESWFRVLDRENIPSSGRFYFYDAWGNVFKSDIETAMRYFGHSVGPPRNSVEHAVGITHLGTLLLRLRDALGMLSGRLMAKQIQATREYVFELRDLAHAQDTDLLVLVIPSRKDVGSPTELFQAAIQIMEEAGLPYINPNPLLDVSSDYATPPDTHWNNSGHQKVGALLSDCVEIYISRGNLADCPHVVLP